ncbi:MAG: class IV adenylate cyclase [Nanoarchaeota archaeon]|nr:class IV adenylate cyclase [Nanoarchaeota archaeon]
MRNILQSKNADFKGTDHQIDTYFNTGNGRLKLREGNIENSLIFYKREDKAGPKKSDIILMKTEPGSAMKDILTKTLGILAVVDKKREIYFIGNVKFHLDNVEGLGTFAEIEAIDDDNSRTSEELLSQCRHYMKLFGIEEKNLMNNSYSDMIIAKKS